MEAYSSPKESSLSSSSYLSSPYSSPNLTALLKIKIISWSQETGLPVTVRVRVGEKSFNLHKFPLMAKSGYFKTHLTEWQEVELPSNFPGGSDTFEMIALFIYGSSTFIDPFNVASLRCASEFLEMSDLSSRTDLYLNQVVLQSWDDTLIVLHKCQTDDLVTLAEDLLIVTRCIESLSFMACMEILDPERKRERPVASLETLASRPWSCEFVKETVGQHLWIKDLIALKFTFFKRVVSSLRRQGMREKFVSPIVVFYANKWILSNKTLQLWECLRLDKDADIPSASAGAGAGASISTDIILQGVLDLLFTSGGEKSLTNRVIIPVGFYFRLLARSVQLGGSAEGRIKLQERITSLLPLAHVEDFLIPKEETDDDQLSSISTSMELGIMKSIFSRYFSSVMVVDETNKPPIGNAVVGELWDMYLVRVGRDPSLTVDEFIHLVEIVPVSCRNSHDHLYRALNVFIQAHPSLTQEEKSTVCKHLTCQNLSQQICIEAVQNESMPLRLIVQALFVQQLNTQQAFRHCSDSFRFAFSDDLSSTQNLLLQEASPLKSSMIVQSNNNNNNEYESTSFRIQTLEQELVSLKKCLKLQKPPDKFLPAGEVSPADRFLPAGEVSPAGEVLSSKIRSFSKRRRADGLGQLGQGTGCIGSVNFGTTQRKCVGKLMSIFRRVSLFGRARLKRRDSVSGL